MGDRPRRAAAVAALAALYLAAIWAGAWLIMRYAFVTIP
jgi:hypothetical protein